MDASVGKIWIAQGGEKYGPYLEVSVRQWLSEGKLSPNAMAWRKGMPQWVLVTTFFADDGTDLEVSQPPVDAAVVVPTESVAPNSAVQMSGSPTAQEPAVGEATFSRHPAEQALIEPAQSAIAVEHTYKTPIEPSIWKTKLSNLRRPTKSELISAVVFGLIWIVGSQVFFGTSSVQDIYQSIPDSPQSADEIISFATGVWTFTRPGDGLWWRYVIKSDGSFTQQSALPAEDNWGDIEEKGHIKPTSGKFSDDGKRWFGFDLIADNFMNNGPARIGQFTIRPDGTLIEIDGGGNPTNVFKHEDANPFSK